MQTVTMEKDVIIMRKELLAAMMIGFCCAPLYGTGVSLTEQEIRDLTSMSVEKINSDSEAQLVQLFKKALIADGEVDSHLVAAANRWGLGLSEELASLFMWAYFEAKERAREIYGKDDRNLACSISTRIDERMLKIARPLFSPKGRVARDFFYAFSDSDRLHAFGDVSANRRNSTPLDQLIMQLYRYAAPYIEFGNYGDLGDTLAYSPVAIDPMKPAGNELSAEEAQKFEELCANESDGLVAKRLVEMFAQAITYPDVKFDAQLSQIANRLAYALTDDLRVQMMRQFIGVLEANLDNGDTAVIIRRMRNLITPMFRGRVESVRLINTLIKWIVDLYERHPAACRDDQVMGLLRELVEVRENAKDANAYGSCGFTPVSAKSQKKKFSLFR